MIYSTLEQAQQAMMSNPADTLGLNERQLAQYTAYETIVGEYGLFDKGIDANGAHYAETNPFAGEGLICANCVFYEQGACEIVAGQIAPSAICKLWIIPETKLTGA